MMQTNTFCSYMKKTKNLYITLGKKALNLEEVVILKSSSHDVKKL